jgi:phage major head subunit gpT-like protein
LEFAGINTERLGKMDLVGRAFTTSDFPLILADGANKSMLKGWSEAPETWQEWATVGNLSDFKLGRRVGLSSFNDLLLVNEDGEYRYGSFDEQGETIQLATYGKLFSISRQAIINDDLAAFTRIPGAMGRAASRVVGDIAYGAITANANLADAVALFHATHNNLNESGAGGTPLTNDAAGVAALAAMDLAMATQSDASSSATALNIEPAFLIVPRALKLIATSLMRDTTAPGQANPGVSNQVQGLAEVVADARLDADSATRYYLFTGQNGDTIEVAFLDGNQAPVLEQQQGWTIDGTEFKVRIDVAAAPMDFRGVQRDDGA